jgi:hypothetical protein
MVIENRQRQVEMYGQAVTISEYRFVAQELRDESAAAGAQNTDCSV